MMAWSSGDGSQQAAEARSMETGCLPPPAPPGLPDEEVEEAVDVLEGSRPGHAIAIEDYDDADDDDDDEVEEEEDDDDESSFRVSSIDEACASKTESSCPSSAGSLGLDPLGLGARRSLSPRHHPLLSPMHMSKVGGGGGGGPGRQVSPARSDAGVSSRAGCKRSVSSAINGKELLSLPPSHSLPVSPLLQRKFFGGRSPQRSYSHSRMVAGRSLTRLSGAGPAVVTISAPDAGLLPPGGPDDDDEQRRRMRDILQNLPLAEIYKKRARRNNSRERVSSGLSGGALGGSSGCASSVPSFSDSTPACESASSAGGQSTMEVFIHTPSQQETPPLSASSGGRHNFKKALRDRYLLSQSYRAGGGSSGGGSSSSQDSAASGGRLPLDLTSERFTKIREPLKSETEDLLVSPHLMLTDDTNPNSPMEPPSIPPPPGAPTIPSILHHPPPQSLSAAQAAVAAAQAARNPHLLHLTSGGSLGDDDAFYPTPAAPAPGSASGPPGMAAAAAVAAAVACNIDPVQLIARTCRIESSSSSYLSVDMDSDPFSPLSPMSPCLVSPKHHAGTSAASATGQAAGPGPPAAGSHHLAPGGPGGGGGSHHHLQPASAATSGHWIQPQAVPAIGVHRGGAPYVGATAAGCGGAIHPGGIPIQRQCQSAPQTPHSSPQIRPQFFFPPHTSHMPPPALVTSAAGPSPIQGGAEPKLVTASSALSSPGLSSGGSLSSPQSAGEGRGGDGSPGAAGVGAGLSPRVAHGCPVCGRSFSRSDMLSRHMRLHTGLKPYECASCGQSFSRSDHLNTHIRTHTGEKPYHCPQCSYSACRRDMITRHMKVHRRKLTGSGASASPPPPPGGSAAGSANSSPRTGPGEIGGSSHSTSGEGPAAGQPG